jgi:hypothetical protein
MNDFIFSPNTNVILPSEKFFCILSEKEFIDDDNNPRLKDESNQNVMAKIKYRPDGSAKYMIRLDNSRRFFNPMSPLPDNKNTKLLQTVSTNDLKFKEVNHRAFDMYLKFLKTSNAAWINNAEREDR